MMSWPKSLKSLRKEYPEADTVVQFRISTKDGDDMTFEGVLPPSVIRAMVQGALQMPSSETCGRCGATGSPMNERGECPDQDYCDERIESPTMDAAGVVPLTVPNAAVDMAIAAGMELIQELEATIDISSLGKPTQDRIAWVKKHFPRSPITVDGKPIGYKDPPNMLIDDRFLFEGEFAVDPTRPNETPEERYIRVITAKMNDRMFGKGKGF